MKRRPLRERDIEKYLVDEVDLAGGVAEKFTSPSRRSVPDRLVQWPEDLSDACDLEPASICFVECKAPGEKPTPAQARDHERRRKMGFRVHVVDSFESVDRVIFMESPK